MNDKAEKHATGKVYGFGTATLDFRITTADFGEGYKEKLLARKADIKGGGSVANALVQASRLGAKCAWLGKLGNDWIGRRIQRQLEDENIDCANVIFDKNLCSPFNVAVYAGEALRRIGGFLIPNSLNELRSQEIKGFAENIGEKDWVIVELGEISLEQVLEFCTAVKEKNAKILLDVDLDPVRQCIGDEGCIEEIFALADILVPNYNSLMAMYPGYAIGDLCEKLARKYAVLTILTNGEDGLYYAEPGKNIAHMSAVKNTHIVDTVGAGDAFHGGLLYGLSRGMALEDALQTAQKCASLNCSKFGAREGMPTLQELELYKIERNIGGK